MGPNGVTKADTDPWRRQMSKIRAAVVDPGAPGRIGVREIDAPVPGPAEALVKVAATSLNFGEVYMAQTAEDGSRIGWDVSGTVQRAAQDGSGPPDGARIVGFVRTGAWAEIIAVPTNALAEIPAHVTFAQAAALPVAGLTALHSVAKGGDLLGRKVLITGASGGVGHMACQIAKLSGAIVVGLVRRESESDLVKELGADHIVVSEDAAGAEKFGPYSLVVDGVGGKVLSNALGMLAKDGMCVVYGATAGAEITFTVWSLVGAGRASLYGLMLASELRSEERV
jgi:NADPH:quinone reductase